MSIHEQARAEAEKAFPAIFDDTDALTYPRSALREFKRGAYERGFLAGHEAATRTRVVTTVTELDALPVGSVVRKAPQESQRVDAMDGSWEQGAVAEKREDRAGRAAWFLVGSELGWRSHQAGLLPARVLYEPEETQ